MSFINGLILFLGNPIVSWVLAVVLVGLLFVLYARFKVKKNVREVVLEAAVLLERLTPENTFIDSFFDRFIEQYKKRFEEDPGPVERSLALKEIQKVKKLK